MTFPKALTRRPGRELAGAELTHLQRHPIDPDLADRQHLAYREALAKLGCALIDLPALDGFADAPFVEDVVLAFPEILVLTRPGAASRRGEVESVAAVLPADRTLARLEHPARLDGGDVLRIGRSVWIGLSSRTNQDGADALERLLQSFGYEVAVIPVAGALHLKTAATALPDGRRLVNPDWIDASRLGSAACLSVDPREPFAANSLWVGQRGLVCAPRTAESLKREGFEVELVDISEFAKAEGGLTCLSVLIPAPA